MASTVLQNKNQPTYTKAEVDTHRGFEKQIAGVSNSFFTINASGQRTISLINGGSSGVGRRFLRVCKAIDPGYCRYRFRLTGRYIYSVSDVIFNQQAFTAAPTKLTGSVVKVDTYTEFAFGLGTDGYLWIVFTTNDLGLQNLIIILDAPDATYSDVIYQSAEISVVGSLVSF
jgi:hypothetical protein